MTAKSLKNRLLLAFLWIIAALGIAIAVLGAYQMRINIFVRTQNKVTQDLGVARAVYQEQLKDIRNAFKFAQVHEDFAAVKEIAGLDYLFVVSKSDAGSLKSEIALEALRTGKEASGSRIIESSELQALGEEFYRRSLINVRSTPMAAPTDKKVLDRALALECALPLYEGRSLRGVIYAGKIINRDFALVDRIRDIVYGSRYYGSKPIGTVTIFVDDTRIATNVVDKDGNRAIGTRVSQKVYDNVVKKGKVWLDRAFVVTDWYVTAYEPIRDIRGNIIGILYVGILEKPFIDILRNIILVFLAIILVVIIAAVAFSIVLASKVSLPLTRLAKAAHRFSDGDLGVRVRETSGIIELDQLAESFNTMADKLDERDRKIQESNEKLTSLNKSYLDLVGFVAHELKAMLSSAILNAYSVRDGFLGLINFKQRRAMDQVTRKLDYLALTVRNFLSLSRIEKGELNLQLRQAYLKEDVFNVSVEEFAHLASERGIECLNNIPEKLALNADADLLLIAANNLVSNAIKYASASGKIVIEAKDSANKITVSVYNDGEPLDAQQREQLFKKFSRVVSAQTRKVQGTGLGLFITKEIVERHGGRIWIESSATGNTFIFEIAKGGK